MDSDDPLARVRANVRKHLGPDARVDVDEDGQIVVRRGDVEMRLNEDDTWTLTEPVDGGTAVVVLSSDFQTEVWAGVVRDGDPDAN